METTQTKPGKGKLIIYWIATTLLAFGMLQSGIFAVLRTDQWVKLLTAFVAIPFTF